MLTFEDAVQSARASDKRQYCLENAFGERYLNYPPDNKNTDVNTFFNELPQKLEIFGPGRYFICCRSSPGQRPVKFGFDYGSKAQSVDPEQVAIMTSGEDRQKILDLTKELLKAEFELKRALAEIEIYKENEAALINEIDELQSQIGEKNLNDGPASFLDNLPEWAQVVVAQAAPRILDKLFPEEMPPEEREPEPEPEPGPVNRDSLDPKQTSILDELNEFRNYGSE